ncbi:hypothetical protein LCGC14_2386940 [marine sediment metagenome]|uniref:Uncharacterized protein n=1 Tax=marine sediment metagenome TaxID=412755 RepID=A0A0F9CLH2_9ZZZZ
MSQTEDKKIEFLYRNYPESKKCQYCDGENCVDHVVFKVYYKNGQSEIVCSVCLYEYALERCKLIKIIENIGEW